MTEYKRDMRLQNIVLNCMFIVILIGWLVDEVATGGAVRRAVTRALERA